MSRRVSIWRVVLVVGYLAWALTCSLVLGGGFTVLVFFGVWAGIWLAFSLFWGWADRTRRLVLRQRGYY